MTLSPTRKHDQVIKSGNRGDIQLGTSTTSPSYGFVFSAQTKPDSGVILINGLDFYTESTDELSFELWTKTGPYDDAKGTYEGWDLIASGFVKGNGVGKYTSIPTELLKPVSVNGSGGMRSFYFSLTSLDLMCKISNQVTTGDDKPYAETHDLKLFEGEGVMFYPFPDPSQEFLYRSQRQLLGRIYYDRMPCKSFFEFGKVNELPCPVTPTGEPTYLLTSNAPSVSPTVPFPTVSPEMSPSTNPTTSIIPTSPPSTLQPTSSPVATFDTYLLVSMINVPGRSMTDDEVDFFVSSTLSFLNKAESNAMIIVESIDLWQQEVVAGVENIAKNGRSLRGNNYMRRVQSQQLTSLRVTLAIRVSSATLSDVEVGDAISEILVENQQDLVGTLQEKKTFEFFADLESLTAQSIESLPTTPGSSDDLSFPTSEQEETKSELVISIAEVKPTGGWQIGLYAGIGVAVLVVCSSIALFLMKRKHASKKNLFVATTSTHKGLFGSEDSDKNDLSLPLSDEEVYETAVCESVRSVESWHENQLSGSLILPDGQKNEVIRTAEIFPIEVVDDSVITIDQEWMAESVVNTSQNTQTFVAAEIVADPDDLDSAPRNESDTSSSSSSSSSSSTTSSSEDEINDRHEKFRAGRVVPNTRTLKKSFSSREFDSRKQPRETTRADEMAAGRGSAPRRLSQSMIVGKSDDTFPSVIRDSGHRDNETENVEISNGLVRTIKPSSREKSKLSSKEPFQSSEAMTVGKVSNLNRLERRDASKSFNLKQTPERSYRQDGLCEFGEDATDDAMGKVPRRKRRDKLSSSIPDGTRATKSKTGNAKVSQSVIMPKSDFIRIDNSSRSATPERHGEPQPNTVGKRNRRLKQNNNLQNDNSVTVDIKERSSSRKKRDKLSSSDSKIKSSKASSNKLKVSQSLILSNSDVSNLLENKSTASERVSDPCDSKAKSKKDTLRRSTSSEQGRRPSTSITAEAKSKSKKKISHRSRSLIVESEQKSKPHKRNNSQNDILPVHSDKLYRLGSHMSGQGDGLRRSKKTKGQSSMMHSSSRNRGKYHSQSMTIGKTGDDDKLFRDSILSQDGSNELEGLKRSNSVKKLRKSSLSEDAGNHPRMMKRSSMDYTAVRKKKYSQGRTKMSQSMTIPRSEFT